MNIFYPKHMNALQLLLAVIVGVGGTSLVAFAWQEPPPGLPPANNAPKPILADTSDQTKNGVLGVTGVFGATPAPALIVNNAALIQATGHVNFGSQIGSGGFGFRSEPGTGKMQFKNNNGSWTSVGSSITHAQYGYTNYSNWSPCRIPNADIVVCEVVSANWATALSNGWTQETASNNVKYMYKEVPGQGTTPWALCTMNSYTTGYDHSTVAFMVKKPNDKWYMYYGDSQFNVNRIAVIANCWR